MSLVEKLSNKAVNFYTRYIEMKKPKYSDLNLLKKLSKVFFQVITDAIIKELV